MVIGGVGRVSETNPMTCHKLNGNRTRNGLVSTALTWRSGFWVPLRSACHVGAGWASGRIALCQKPLGEGEGHLLDRRNCDLCPRQPCPNTPTASRPPGSGQNRRSAHAVFRETVVPAGKWRPALPGDPAPDALWDRGS